MHVGGQSDSLIATGGADAKVTVWRDVTAQEAAKTAAAAAAGVQQQQALANALQVRCTACLPLAVGGSLHPVPNPERGLRGLRERGATIADVT